jgi:hypothetical protein
MEDGMQQNHGLNRTFAQSETLTHRMSSAIERDMQQD